MYATDITTPSYSGYSVKYDAASDAILCTGNFAEGTTATLYNMGGLSLGTATANDGLIALPVEGAPRGSYLVVIRGDEGEYVYKIAL